MTEATWQPPHRRSFLYRLAAALVGAVAIVPVALAAVAFLLSPLRRGRIEPDSAGDFLPLGRSPEALPGDGTPERVAVLADRVDAWNRHPRQPIGTVWLRKLPDGSVAAWTSICPHLGCAVDFRRAQGDFFCPCHTSTFDLDGKRLNRIPPRDMDSLEVRVQDDQIWIRYQRFRGGIADKVVV